ncbi:TetR/AcrR family transcriptional regulator [Streptomyces sp. XD-27]|uniref:TetR/AcrR family transcriptional regulator n=1 Tax=Streptomyces sp. XD-27 TaxID=3062779 RepID=UPI0026F439D1|nr:TetR/AcrR family transcriptional regulator [Streptomyces sp. XD-27]WKX71007.1 TetR/AcrR family transcriptional regulator [Streptomyces sp. XD-27]
MTTEHSGSGDVSRSLELLWGMAQRPSRGPKPGLALDRIVATAVRIADAEGLAAVSMRRLSTELGVGTMSLYRYIPGKAELLDLMLDHVNGFDAHDSGLGADAHDSGLGLGWRAVLEQVARGTWELYGRHPWLLHVDQGRPILGPNAMAGLEFALRGLDGLGLTDREMINVLVAVDGYVTGTARSHLNSVLAEKRTGVSNEDFWNAQAPVLEKVIASGRFPTQAKMSMDAFSGTGEEVFELGLTSLLDGLEKFIEAHERPRAPEPPEE